MMAVAVSRQDPKQLFCVTRDGEVFATTDGGATWQAYPLPPGVEDVYALACT
ncbi:MAG: hypothetical protein KatS3mg131_0440 [Candidatus Tectimicrobiota bacterium]|nr:MAG: hypothetical protein KatS3mg131_0440 [Candidatus Tectomicrobia bacterium]